MNQLLQETLEKGVELHLAGKFDLAAQLYEAVLKIQPEHADANHNMGLLKLDEGEPLKALPYLQIALQADTNITQFWLSYMKALIKLNRKQEAARILDLAKESGIESQEFHELGQLLNASSTSTSVAAQKINTPSTFNTNVLDNLKLNQAPRSVGKKTAEAVTEETKNQAQHGLAALNKPTQVRINERPTQDTINKLINLYRMGQLQAAVALAQQLTRQYPEEFLVWNLLGAAQKGLGRLFEASQAFKRVIELNPNSADGFNNLGTILQEQGKFEEAIEIYKKALSLKPDYAAAYNNMGNTLKEQNKLNEAMEAFGKAISLEPDFAEAYNNMGNVFKEQRKLREAFTSYEKALSIMPNYADAFNNLGIVLGDQGKLEEAVEAFNNALSLKPDFAAAYINMGNTLAEQNKLDEAIEAYDKVTLLQPEHSYAQAQKLHHRARICDWQKVELDYHLLEMPGFERKSVSPFSLLSLDDVPEKHKIRSEAYAREKFLPKPISEVIRPRQKPVRLRLGYFSSDFSNHPVAHLLAKVIESHDRNRFDIFGYSLGTPNMDAMRERLSKGFDNFRDVHCFSDDQIVKLAQDDGIDIAIDLTGYMKNNRSNIFSYRLAPIQINYLGFPGSMGADFMDYIIADQNLIPEEFQRYYTEKPIYLPHHYQAQDDELKIASETPTRSSLGLPEKGFVFCAINNTYKISPREFDIWMRLLRKVNGSVLWLLEANKWVKENLIKEASTRGVSSERLVFAQKTSHEKYLAQFRQADLYLDTFNYNAGATASNALWAGLPVLTKQGKSYTARMASSLLKSIGLPELITTSEPEYENLALTLAQNSEHLMSIKQKLALNRKTEPLFNTKLFTRHLENAYNQAYQNYLDGKEPDTIFVHSGKI